MEYTLNNYENQLKTHKFNRNLLKNQLYTTKNIANSMKICLGLIQATQ